MPSPLFFADSPPRESRTQLGKLEKLLGGFYALLMLVDDNSTHKTHNNDGAAGRNS